MLSCRVGVSPCRSASGGLRGNKTQLVHISQGAVGHTMEMSRTPNLLMHSAAA